MLIIHHAQAHFVLYSCHDIVCVLLLLPAVPCYKFVETKLWDYGSVMDQVSPDVSGSKLEADGDISITINEPDSESPLARRRDGQSTSTTGQDHSPAARGLPLSSPQCLTSSLTIAESTYQESPQTCSLMTEKIASVSVLEPIAVQKVGETHKTEKACSENEGRLGNSPVRESGVRTDREIDATVQRNVSTMSMAFSLGATMERLSLLHGHGGALMEKEGEGEGRRFRAKINPASNSQAEEELRKHIRYSS